MSNRIEQTIDSREVAEMVGKEHNMLLRDIRRYVKQLGQSKIAQSNFFTESTYKNSQNKEMPCYRITKKGCEFIAHKLTGTKGTIFTARYINRFHEMQDMITGQAAEQEPQIPWFIRMFEGRYIILERDFIQITGVDITKHKAFYREEYFRGGWDYNGWGWYTTIDKKEFKDKYGFDYGEDKCMFYFYLCGAAKAIRILVDDKKTKMNEGAYAMIEEGIKAVQSPKKKELGKKKSDILITADTEQKNRSERICINITLGEEPKIMIG